jgi:hypothetical protein
VLSVCSRGHQTPLADRAIVRASRISQRARGATWSLYSQENDREGRARPRWLPSTQSKDTQQRLAESFKNVIHMIRGWHSSSVAFSLISPCELYRPPERPLAGKAALASPWQREPLLCSRVAHMVACSWREAPPPAPGLNCDCSQTPHWFLAAPMRHKWMSPWSF